MDMEFTESKRRIFFKKQLPIALIITVFLLGGTGSNIFSKTAYQTQAIGRDGEMHYFIKPLFFNWGMFLGMSFCLVIYFMQYHVLPFFQRSRSEEKKDEKKSMSLKGYLLMLIPAFCDFLATYLMNFGLIWVSSSIFQMMRGVIIVFTALFTVFYRKQKLFMYEITGVCIIVVSLVIVGLAAFCPGYQEVEESSLEGNGDVVSSAMLYTIIGLVLIIVAQLLQSFQNIIEEQALHDISAPVTFVVGLEGIYGLIICSVLMPIMGMDWVPGDLYEDSYDTFVMLVNSPVLIVETVLYIVSVFLFNVAGMMATDYVNAMARNVMEPLRMITTWIVSVFLYYVVDPSIGEKVGLFTILEIIGFIALTFGFLLYTKVIKIPKVFNYEGKQKLSSSGSDSNSSGNTSSDSTPLFQDSDSDI